ncbi:MAG: hypothetical protein Q4Q58_06730, partial [Thermoplasmata archaeon]|nr:hypothetical protein [Thermoplasmata archaeon]
DEEFEAWVDDVVMPYPEDYGFTEVDVDEEDREYLIIPKRDSWTVKGHDAAAYYDGYADMTVGGIPYRTDNFELVRVSNRGGRGRRR